MRTRALHRLMAAGSLAGALLVGACGDFNVTNPNQPTLDDLSSNPTRTKLATAATGILIGLRASTGAAGTLTGQIWRLGSMGREGVNLSGNNQPDYIEPYFGPLSGTGFGGTEWTNFYSAIRSANIYLDAAPKAAQVVGPEGLSSAEISASLGYGKTLKALAFMYIVAGHGSLGAPVDVDHPITDPPAPFVSEDSVYGYIIATLNDAQNDLTTAGSTAFPFPLPSGFSGFDTPATFLAFNRALAAKAYIFRATALNSSCGGSCYPAALAAIAAAAPTFGGLSDPSQFQTGVYMNFSAGAGDTQNDLSDALDAPIYFAVPQLVDLAQKQADGTTPDARVLAKTAAATASTPQKLGGIPIIGTLKFTNYLTGGNADPSAPVPLIRNEELVLLRAEANIGLNDFASALADINFIRTNSGKLPALGSLGTEDEAITELLYNRRYSLLWEQGATWVDARRYDRIVLGPDGVHHQIVGIGELPGFGTGNFNPSDVPLRLLVPDDECRARGLESGCSPLGT